uniref:Uncharacterized protein n=1 Tax=Xiphophorus couchianus TaxID=32473 RepID=A0A3B5MC01_9TELE
MFRVVFDFTWKFTSEKSSLHEGVLYCSGRRGVLCPTYECVLIQNTFISVKNCSVKTWTERQSLIIKKLFLLKQHKKPRVQFANADRVKDHHSNCELSD